MSNVLLVLAFVGAGLAAAFHVYIQGLAGAFGTGPGGGRPRAPWELGLEDFVLLIVLPFGPVLLLVLAALALRGAAAWRERRRG